MIRNRWIVYICPKKTSHFSCKHYDIGLKAILLNRNSNKKCHKQLYFFGKYDLMTTQMGPFQIFDIWTPENDWYKEESSVWTEKKILFLGSFVPTNNLSDEYDYFAGDIVNLKNKRTTALEINAFKSEGTSYSNKILSRFAFLMEARAKKSFWHAIVGCEIKWYSWDKHFSVVKYKSTK